MTGKQISYAYDFIGISIGDQHTAVEHMRTVRTYLSTCADVPGEVFEAIQDSIDILNGKG